MGVETGTPVLREQQVLSTTEASLQPLETSDEGVGGPGYEFRWHVLFSEDGWPFSLPLRDRGS